MSATLQTNDAPDLNDFDDDDSLAFYRNITGEPEADAAPPGEGDEAAAETEGTEAPAETEGTEAAATTPEDDADPEIELKIGDAPRKLKTSELRALVERSETLTAKETAAVTAAEHAAAEGQKASTAVTRMLERAQARWEPYKDINLLVLAQRVDEGTLTAIQKDMQDAYNDVQFFQQELTALTEQTTQAQAATRQAAAAEALKVINTKDSPAHIPNFDQKLYGDMVNFATTLGLDQNAVMGITDPGALKLIHMAMQFAAGQKATSAVTPVVHKPKTTMKPASGKTPSNATDARSAAMAKLRRSGSEDDAVAAFLALGQD